MAAEAAAVAVAVAAAAAAVAPRPQAVGSRHRHRSRRCRCHVWASTSCSGGHRSVGNLIATHSMTMTPEPHPRCRTASLLISSGSRQQILQTQTCPGALSATRTNGMLPSRPYREKFATSYV